MARRNVRALKITLWIAAVIILLGSYQNFSELGSPKYEYQLLDLGHLGHEQSRAFPLSINNKGEVAGYSVNSSGNWHAFHWSANGGMKDLGTLGGSKSIAYFIDDHGHIVGESENKKGLMKPFLYKQGKMTELASDTRTGRALAMNREGFIVGSLTSPNGTSRAVVWTPQGQLTELVPSEESRVGAATSGNPNGEIAGWSGVTLGNITRAFLWKDSKATELGTLGGHSAMAHAINSKGWIVGESETAEKVFHPVLWRQKNGKFEIIDLFSSLPSKKASGKAIALNDRGEIVGSGMTPEGPFTFIWSSDDGLRNLSRLVRETDPEFPNRNWFLQQATALNNCGYIVGHGNSDDLTSGGAFLLFPVKPREGCEKMSR